MDTIVRNLNSLQEVRRVVRKLLDTLSVDQSKLARIKRALNVSALKNPELYSALAAKGKFTEPTEDDDDKPATTNTKVKVPVRKAAPKGKPLPVPKAKPKDDVKVSSPKGKTTPKTPPQKVIPAVKSKNAKTTKPDENEDTPPPAKKVGGLITRTNDDADLEPVENIKITRDVHQHITKLSNLLTEQQHQLDVANNLKHLVIHNFSPEDDTRAARLNKLIDTVLTHTNDMVDETKGLLNKLGEKHVSPEFSNIVETVYKKLKKKFTGKYKTFTYELSLATGTHQNELATFFFGYLIFKELQGRHGLQDEYVIVITHVAPFVDAGAKETNRKAVNESTRTDKEAARQRIADEEAKKAAAKNGNKKPKPDVPPKSLNVTIREINKDNSLDEVEKEKARIAARKEANRGKSVFKTPPPDAEFRDRAITLNNKRKQAEAERLAKLRSGRSGNKEEASFRVHDAMRIILADEAAKIPSNAIKPDNFIRTWTDYRPPTFLARSSIGTSFGTDINRAVKLVLLLMQHDQLIDTVDPIKVPLEDSDVQSIMKKHKEIEHIDVNDKKGQIEIYLNPAIKDEKQANEIGIQAYKTLTSILKQVHSRYRSQKRMLPPTKVKTTIKGKPAEQWKVDMVFMRPEGEPDTDISNDKWQKIENIIGFESPSMGREFIKKFKQFLGVK